VIAEDQFISSWS